MSDLIDIKDKILIKAKMVSLEMELLKLSIHDGFKEMKTNQVSKIISIFIKYMIPSKKSKTS